MLSCDALKWRKLGHSTQDADNSLLYASCALWSNLKRRGEEAYEEGAPVIGMTVR